VDNGTISDLDQLMIQKEELQRTNLNASLSKPIDYILESQCFYSKYDFELYSNFTFFLEPYKWRPIKKGKPIYLRMNAELNKKIKVMIGMLHFN
jgi:hypothetical protein